MGPIEIVTIILVVLVVVGILAGYAVRRIKGKPTGGCAGCPYSKDCGHGGCGSHHTIDLSKYKKDDDSEQNNG
ncbi:MAG: hypothetical protein NC037_01230 [Bacteroides sp.]|nr:hypothetical protein [Bacillota bacterium]MCM1393953.1 hypothetical protein [[Eubacterium] siraeum]MCM1455139.1 hypothetical protein [Bacteroides sp.]